MNMLARIGSKVVLVLMVGMTWLGSYNGCDSGVIYGNAATLVGGPVAHYDGAYVAGSEVYYPVDPGYAGYVYDPYIGACETVCY
jgi:hypothetical protein